MDIPPEKTNTPSVNRAEKADPIRVLQVFASLDRGGAETMVMNLYRAIDRRQIQFEFIVSDSESDHAYEDEIRSMGGRIYRLPRYGIINFFEYCKPWKNY